MKDFQVIKIKTFSTTGVKTEFRLSFDKNDVGSFKFKDLVKIHSCIGNLIEKEKHKQNEKRE